MKALDLYFSDSASSAGVSSMLGDALSALAGAYEVLDLFMGSSFNATGVDLPDVNATGTVSL